MNKTNGNVKDVAALQTSFSRTTPEARRQALLPFVWNELAAKGQIFGNRTKGSEAHITNARRFSYPGYNEFLSGAADDARITSNNKIPNPNTNVFEWLNTQRGFTGKVAAIVNWDVIPWILNAERSRLPVWTGFPLPANAVALKVSPEVEQLVADTTPHWGNIVFDSFAARAAVDYVKQSKPRAFYLAFGETDEWAHEGRYDQYLRSAHNVDRFIQRLWETVQSLPAYRNQTTFIVTTDHGRGSGPSAWRDHGKDIAGAEHIWVAVIGPDTPSLGERANCPPVTQSQIAATVAAFLGKDYATAFPHVAPPIADVVRR
jgi:hypothetical protein